MTSSDMLNVPEDKMAEALLLLNELNNSYRWVKFCIDEDRDLLVRTDAIVSEETAGKELLELTLRMSSIIDDAWPKIMRMRFS